MEQPAVDDKDWTWILDEPCPECGFDAAQVSGSDVAGIVDDARHRFTVALTRPDAKQRPEPRTWSTLEYACHVRDVNRIFTERVELMLNNDDPQFPNWDQDETAVTDRYAEQIPSQVAAELQVQFTDAARIFGSVQDEQWVRRGRRSNGSVFTVDSLGRYFAHDLVHHLHDISA
ncbi:DinB family protein [Jatrophihabitans sp. GAS493]|uniref:DinB family protein n=1 Tax=Jatrophihabitans sp. GAS493 TaxID=1907575 RepID=UPI000BB7EC48|nr:DinB family protein [Jatrophihabitans sp. GAS493]SOD70458.1 DinB family protein [Jatrophihabitans sp. GAS493]